MTDPIQAQFKQYKSKIRCKIEMSAENDQNV